MFIRVQKQLKLQRVLIKEKNYVFPTLLPIQCNSQHIGLDCICFYLVGASWFCETGTGGVWLLLIIDFFRNTSAECLEQDSVCLNELRCIRNCGARSHHCGFYTKVQWPFLYLRRLGHWYVLICKVWDVSVLFIILFNLEKWGLQSHLETFTPILLFLRSKQKWGAELLDFLLQLHGMFCSQTTNSTI